MTHRLRLLPIVAAVALVGAACAADETATDTPDDAVEEDAGADEDDPDADAEDSDAADDADTDSDADDSDAADEDAAGEQDADGDDASADGPASAAAGTATAGIEVASSDLGDHIVTAEGVTTYAAVDQRDGEVTCVADCAQVWPPVIADGELSVGDGIDAELVTTITLDDGREQVAVAGAPLHTFVVDAAPGDVSGQGSADRWFVLSPAGELVGAAAE